MAHIDEIAQHDGQTVTLRGWLHNRRSSGKLHFLTIRDGSGFIQAVMSKAAVGDTLFAEAGHLGQETALTVEGVVRADARAPGGYEMDVTGLDVVGAAADYPITPKSHGVDFLLDRRHLWIRSERQHAVLRVRHTVINAVRDFLIAQGVSGARIETISFGKERPIDPGSSEEAWAKNRNGRTAITDGAR